MVKSQHHYSRYQRFMDALKGQSIDGYCEVHHIVPRSLGGSNDKENLISLTARQHYIAHWILARALGGSAARAFFMMSNFGKYGKVNSTTYAIARKEYSGLVSEQMIGRILPPVSLETKEKQSKAGKIPGNKPDARGYMETPERSDGLHQVQYINDRNFL